MTGPLADPLSLLLIGGAGLVVLLLLIVLLATWARRQRYRAYLRDQQRLAAFRRRLERKCSHESEQDRG